LAGPSVPLRTRSSQNLFPLSKSIENPACAIYTKLRTLPGFKVIAFAFFILPAKYTKNAKGVYVKAYNTSLISSGSFVMSIAIILIGIVQPLPGLAVGRRCRYFLRMFNTCGVFTSLRKRTPQGFNIYSRRKTFPTRGTPPGVQQIMAISMSYEPLDSKVEDYH
jgi:hypothetical protein